MGRLGVSVVHGAARGAGQRSHGSRSQVTCCKDDTFWDTLRCLKFQGVSPMRFSMPHWVRTCELFRICVVCGQRSQAYPEPVLSTIKVRWRFLFTLIKLQRGSLPQPKFEAWWMLECFLTTEQVVRACMCFRSPKGRAQVLALSTGSV